MQKTIHILLLEDTSSDAELIQRMLRGHASLKVDVDWVQSMEAAIESLEFGQFDLIISDLGLPDSFGLETISSLRNCAQQTPIIALTSEDACLGMEAIRTGANDYLQKDSVTGPIISRAVDHTLQRFEMTRELEEANKKLERKNVRLARMYKMSQQIVDNVSHEFRTPLTVIREFAAIVRDGIDGPVTAKQKGRLSTLITRTDDLALMVDDLLDSSQLESGLLKTCRKVTNLSEIVSQVETMLRPRAMTKKIELKVRDISTELRVFCDEEKLRRILINLIVNAIKFTPVEGTIEILVATADDNRVKITVSDNGHGIPKEDLNRIFNRFQQVRAHERMASCKGFGLGLSIARALASLNLGSLQVSSVEGEGSQFSVLVPVARVDAVLSCYLDQLQAASSDSSVISVVEVHAESLCPENADEVIETIDDFLRSSVTNFDLVLMMNDGRWLFYTSKSKKSLPRLFDRIRDDWTKHARNYSGTELPALSLESLDTIEIRNGRERLLQSTRFHESPILDLQSPSDMTQVNRKQVLVVDDELEVAGAIESRLEANGFDVSTVHDGLEGLEAARNSEHDAILLDIRMPKMDGLTVLDELKSDPKTKNTPVIILSASLQDQQIALDRGASFFVQKPFKSDAIMNALNSAILEFEASNSQPEIANEY